MHILLFRRLCTPSSRTPAALSRLVSGAYNVGRLQPNSWASAMFSTKKKKQNKKSKKAPASPMSRHQKIYPSHYKPTEEEIQEELEWVESLLKPAEAEEFGKKRGEESIREHLRVGRSRNRRLNNHTVRVELRSLIYMRFALQNGVLRLKQLAKKNGMGKALFGEDTTVNVTLETGKAIIYETFKYGRSGLFECLKDKEDRDNEKRRLKKEERAAARLAKEQRKEETEA